MKGTVKKVIEGILFLVLLLSVSAMDSPDNTMPIIGTMVSLLGLAVMAQEETALSE